MTGAKPQPQFAEAEDEEREQHCETDDSETDSMAGAFRGMSVEPEVMTRALCPDGGEAALSEPLQAAAKVLSEALTVQEATLVSLCARVGAQDTAEQLRVRDKLEAAADVQSALAEVDAAAKALGSGGFFAGEQPGAEDAQLVSALIAPFALALKPAQRGKFAALEAWFARCSELVNARVHGAGHVLGCVRAGGQIDCFADSAAVRANADATNQLNATFKKKKTQRQLEKEAKGKTSAPAAAESNLFETAVPAEASVDDKVEMVRKALEQIGAKADGEVLRHPPAKSMAEMPAELKSKGGFVCKNLFVKSKKPRKGVEGDSCVWLICVPEQRVVDLKGLAAALGYKAEFRQTKPEVLLETMGLLPGGVTPFGLINDKARTVNVVLDSDMMSSPENVLWLHPCTNEATMGVTADSLFKLVAASGRTPVLHSFADAGAAPAADDSASGAEAATSAAAEPLGLTHDEALARLRERLKQEGIEPRREENPDLSAKRPVGHSTHNLLVKDKKSKKLFMISMRQHVECNLKDIAKVVKAKELRLTSAKESLCHEKGCMSLLNLYNNVQGDVTPVIDSKLFEAESLRICLGCDDPVDHSQHNIVDVPPAVLKKLLEESNTPAAISVDLE